MKKRIKLTAVVLSCLMIFSLISTSVFAANTTLEFVEGTSIDFNTDSQILIDSKLVGPVLVFFAGVLVGYIIDGVIVYVSGRSAAEWVSLALGYYKKNKGVKTIHVSKSGQVHGGSGGKF